MSSQKLFFVPVLSCLLVSLLQPAISPAATLTFTADTVQASYDHVDNYAVSGPGFSFQGFDLGDNLGYPVFTQSELGGEGIVAGQTLPYPSGAGAQLTGYITINGVQTAALFSGFASTPFGSTLTPSSFPVQPSLVSINLPPIIGSFTVCLAVSGSSPSRPCDPNFLNIATVNVNLPGYLTFGLSGAFQSGPYQEAFVQSETYTASAALAPEPSSSSLLAGGFVGLASLFLFQRLRRLTTETQGS